MNICTISGSSRPESANARLLDALPALAPGENIFRYAQLDALPIFKPEADHHPWPEEVLRWRKTIKEADAIIICTPEYIHNLPALIKNALEWVVTSGELNEKRVLAITFTPHPPRGEKAMQSLQWSLQALGMNIVAELPLYQNEVRFSENGEIIGEDSLEMLREGIALLVN